MVVEGHGEQDAALNLITRLWQDLGLRHTSWVKPIRGQALNTRAGVLKACELLRSKADCTHALLLRDEDDGCPRDAGPQTAQWVRESSLPFPAAVVLAHREFETWFLPCVHLMAGRTLTGPEGVERPGLEQGARFEGSDFESIRGVKEWLSKHYAGGRSYKPTLDQLALTRMIDLNMLRAANVPSFGTLERALRFLAEAKVPEVYPPARST